MGVIVGMFVVLLKTKENVSKISEYINNNKMGEASVFYRQIELQTIGNQLPSDLMLSLANEQYAAQDILGGHKTLAYHFTQMQCKACIESQIEALKAVFWNDTTNIILLANTTNYRSLYVFSHTHNIKYPIYKLDESLKLPPDTLMMPYFLLIDENLKVVNAFITMKERMNYSILYLKSMYRYFHPEGVSTNALDITINKKRIDLGTNISGSSKTVKFIISNNSEQNIQLDVIPDCDCTTIDFGNGTLQAQEKRQITATIRFDEKGNFVKYIYVYYNNNQNPMEVEIRGSVN